MASGTLVAPRGWLHNGSVGYLLAYGIPVVLIASLWLAAQSPYANAVVFLPLVVGYVLVPVAQDVWPRVLMPVPEPVAASRGWRAYYRLLPMAIVPVELAMAYAAAWFWSYGGLDAVGRLGLLLSTGIFSAMFAINGAHELIHRRERFDRWIGGLLLSTVAFGAFKVVHLEVHHRFVGTARDHATARRGQGIYAYWRQALLGNARGAVRVERGRLARNGLSLWHSELLLWYGLSTLWLAGAVVIGGAAGGLFFALQSLIAILKLEWMNYLQHYGLTRAADARGRLETVRAGHAWSQGKYLQNLVLFNLLRHGDHHENPQRPYQSLRHREDAPQYPYDYAVMILLSLVPPLFRRVVHPCLDRFRMDHRSGEPAR